MKWPEFKETTILKYDDDDWQDFLDFVQLNIEDYISSNGTHTESFKDLYWCLYNTISTRSKYDLKSRELIKCAHLNGAKEITVKEFIEQVQNNEQPTTKKQQGTKKMKNSLGSIIENTKKSAKEATRKQAIDKVRGRIYDVTVSRLPLTARTFVKKKCKKDNPLMNIVLGNLLIEASKLEKVPNFVSVIGKDILQTAMDKGADSLLGMVDDIVGELLESSGLLELEGLFEEETEEIKYKV